MAKSKKNKKASSLYSAHLNFTFLFYFAAGFRSYLCNSSSKNLLNKMKNQNFEKMF